MMPVLLVLVVVIAGYSLTLKNMDANGVTRTGLQGFLYFITPHVTAGMIITPASSATSA